MKFDTGYLEGVIDRFDHTAVEVIETRNRFILNPERLAANVRCWRATGSVILHALLDPDFKEQARGRDWK